VRLLGDGDAVAAAAGQLARVARRIGASLALDDTVSAIADGAVDLLGFHLAVVSLVDDDGLCVAAVSAAEPSVGLRPGMRLPRVGWEDSSCHPTGSVHAPLLEADGSLLGVLTVSRSEGAEAPSPAIRAMLDAFAQLAAIAVRNAREHEALVRSETMQRRFFDESSVGMALFDVNGRFHRVNAAYCEFLGRTPEELIGHAVSEFAHPDEVGLTAALSREVRAGVTRAYKVDKRYLHADGRVVWVTGSPFSPKSRT
jgi:PAS domain S-box-containing protein